MSTVRLSGHIDDPIELLPPPEVYVLASEGRVYGADIRIYNYALTANQIKNLYNGGSAVRFGPSSGQP